MSALRSIQGMGLAGALLGGLGWYFLSKKAKSCNSDLPVVLDIACQPYEIGHGIAKRVTYVSGAVVVASTVAIMLLE